MNGLLLSVTFVYFRINIKSDCNTFIHNISKESNAFPQPSSSDTGSKHPNILVLMGDDFGYSDIGPFGSEITTPNLDTLAKEGKILTNYHTNSVCSSSKSSIPYWC